MYIVSPKPNFRVCAGVGMSTLTESVPVSHLLTRICSQIWENGFDSRTSVHRTDSPSQMKKTPFGAFSSVPHSGLGRGNTKHCKGFLAILQGLEDASAQGSTFDQTKHSEHGQDCSETMFGLVSERKNSKQDKDVFESEIEQTKGKSCSVYLLVFDLKLAQFGTQVRGVLKRQNLRPFDIESSVK